MDYWTLTGRQMRFFLKMLPGYGHIQIDILQKLNWNWNVFLFLKRSFFSQMHI